MIFEEELKEVKSLSGEGEEKEGGDECGCDECEECNEGKVKGYDNEEDEEEEDEEELDDDDDDDDDTDDDVDDDDEIGSDFGISEDE